MSLPSRYSDNGFAIRYLFFRERGDEESEFSTLCRIDSWDVRIGASSLRLLARGKDYANPYPARVGLATHAWAKDHRGLLIRFIKANFMAVDWILDQENKHDAVALMTTWMGRTNEGAEKDYNRIVGPEGALPRRGAFDPSPLQTVLALRLKTGLMNPPAPPLNNKYFRRQFLQRGLFLGWKDPTIFSR